MFRIFRIFDVRLDVADRTGNERDPAKIEIILKVPEFGSLRRLVDFCCDGLVLVLSGNSRIGLREPCAMEEVEAQIYVRPRRLWRDVFFGEELDKVVETIDRGRIGQTGDICSELIVEFFDGVEQLLGLE